MQVAKALARLRKGTESSELSLLAHAMNKNQRRLRVYVCGMSLCFECELQRFRRDSQMA